MNRYIVYSALCIAAVVGLQIVADQYAIAGAARETIVIIAFFIGGAGGVFGYAGIDECQWRRRWRK